jgi:hypothetical protein
LGATIIDAIGNTPLVGMRSRNGHVRLALAAKPLMTGIDPLRSLAIQLERRSSALRVSVDWPSAVLAQMAVLFLRSSLRVITDAAPQLRAA